MGNTNQANDNGNVCSVYIFSNFLFTTTPLCRDKSRGGETPVSQTCCSRQHSVRSSLSRQNTFTPSKLQFDCERKLNFPLILFRTKQFYCDRNFLCTIFANNFGQIPPARSQRVKCLGDVFKEHQP